MLEAFLEEADQLTGDARTQVFQRMVDMATQPKELVENICTHILGTPKKHLWDIAIECIRYIGYPQNEPALSFLVELFVDGNWPGREEALKTIREIRAEKVAPFFIEIYLDQGEEREYWDSDVEGISLALATLGSKYIDLCLPSILLILTQKKLVDQLDMEMVLRIFESIEVKKYSECLPVFYNLYRYIENKRIQAKIVKYIFSYPKEIINLYKNVFSRFPLMDQIDMC